LDFEFFGICFLGIWCLFVIWCLEFGISLWGWCLEFPPASYYFSTDYLYSVPMGHAYYFKMAGNDKTAEEVPVHKN
jgi:hypothetical protein